MTTALCRLTWPTDQIALITLNRPQKLNAINVEMLSQWRDHLQTLTNRDTPPRCLLITGSGRAFSAGADILSTAAVAQEYEGNLGKILQMHYHPVIEALRDLPFPVISAVNGLAVGVGFSFALHGDIILASEDAYFWCNFSHVGLAPDGGMSHLLPRCIGHHRAMAISLLAEKISASEAQTLGIVHKIFTRDTLLDGAINLAQQISCASATAMTETKLLLRSALDHSLEDQLTFELNSQTRAGTTPDAQRAMRDFLSKK